MQSSDTSKHSADGDDISFCDKCGDELNLDGYDGLCGNCADKALNNEEPREAGMSESQDPGKFDMRFVGDANYWVWEDLCKRMSWLHSVGSNVTLVVGMRNNPGFGATYQVSQIFANGFKGVPIYARPSNSAPEWVWLDNLAWARIRETDNVE